MVWSSGFKYFAKFDRNVYIMMGCLGQLQMFLSKLIYYYLFIPPLYGVGYITGFLSDNWLYLRVCGNDCYS